MYKICCVPVVLSACLCFMSPGQASAEVDAAAMRSLDEQVQQIKSDVLDITTELTLLEEQLLFPAHSHVSVFVSMQEGADVRLDGVELSIDGEAVTHHIYSFNELDALHSGGVQRLYTGNLPRGEHALEVALIGKTEDGKDFRRSHQFTFSKQVEPQMLGLTVSNADVDLNLSDW